MPAPVLHQAVVEQMGQAIVNGDLAADTAVILDDVMQRTRSSRTVAREAVRVLETLGMVAMKRRIGNVVLPRSNWRVSDPRVIRWRLSGVHRTEELDQLMQLRAGIEPIAARLSASAAPADVGPRMTELAGKMTRLGLQGQGITEEFLAADLEFHRLLVTSCGNDHIMAFSDTLAEILTERNRLGLLGHFPDPGAMAAHRALGEAITQRSPSAAEAATRDLVDIVHAEVLAPPPGEGTEPGPKGRAPEEPALLPG